MARRGYCFLCGDYVELETHEKIVLFDEGDLKSGMCPAHAEEIKRIGKILALEDEIKQNGSRGAKKRLLDLKFRELPDHEQESFRELEAMARASRAKINVNSDAYRAGWEAGGRVDLFFLDQIVRRRD